MKMLLLVAAVLVIGLLGLLAAGRLGLLAGTAPLDLGVKNGRLKAPSRTANSVSSQAALYRDHPRAAIAAIDPLPVLGDAAVSLARLRSLLAATEGMRLVQTAPDYLRAEARTPWLGFVDDLEFWFEPAAGLIQVRSASRLGRLDFGANRARIERIRKAYLAGG